MKQFGERGMDKAGIKLIGTGDVTDDDQLNDMGDVALGVVTSHHYSATTLGRQQEVRRASEGQQGPAPQLHGRGRLRRHARDLRALKKTGGKGGGDALLAAMKGQIFESPRGPRCFIDAQTRDSRQNVYLRKVEAEGTASCDTSSSTC
jgi:branched-chain amino acid transport system substrate-binding protein